MKVLLLGATGLLGHNVLRRLQADGHEVRVLVRKRAALLSPVADECVVVGRLTHTATLSKAAKGCDAIINCAGTTDMSLRRLADYLPINSDLCDSLVHVMEKRKITRLVHISSTNTIGLGTADCPAREDAPMNPPFDRSHYARSKRLGELILQQAAQRHTDWHIVIVNAGYMLGPWDAKPSSGKMLQVAYRRRTAFAPRGGKAFVDVRDVAAAAVHALTMGQHGHRYLVTQPEGELSIAQLYALQAEVMGYEQRVRPLPNWLMRIAGWIGNVCRAVGFRTSLSSCNVCQLMISEHYDSSAARTELLMPCTPLSTSISDFHSWQNQYKPKKK